MKKDISNIEKIFKKSIVIVIGMFILSMALHRIEPPLNIEANVELQNEEKERVNDQEKEVMAQKSVENWIEYKNKDANYDEKNKTLSISSNLMKTFKKSKGIASANYEIYETTKELESLFKDDIDSYKFNFSEELADNYGNKRKDVVYSIILNRNELDKVNWDGIEPSMLIDLASHNYKSPVLQ
ncbi:hypothetical protein UT300012_15310 [Paraclostridium bifermentans]|uniref:hypothetical protein n=1 Tax=Paraclostridium bifermentans TaxID=1490 RepID=UPI001C123CC4|nr:hypothetical protein [Paraclostridium bifermentans]MBU5288170.1 hypothetical protein [Paraclostridium bifermentans]